MALKLKGSDERTLFGNDEFVIEGHTYRLYLDDENERWHLQKHICLENYKWFKEQTGLGRWVLYNPNQYKLEKNRDNRDILVFNHQYYDGSRLEVPINASSCCGMFSWTTLPDELVLTSAFDTREIVDMSLMFAGTKIPKYFSLGTHFHTNNVVDMHYMFYKTIFSHEFNFKFNTRNVEDFNHLFARAKMPSTCKIDLCTDSAKDVSYMFYETRFRGVPEFSKEFWVDDSIMNTDSMFLRATLNEELVGRELLGKGYVG